MASHRRSGGRGRPRGGGVRGHAVLSLTGQYSDQRQLPSAAAESLFSSSRHVAGLDLAVGVIPFAGTLVAAYLWPAVARGPTCPRSRACRVVRPQFLVVLVAFTGYQQSAGSDLPRIHERYLIYVLPLFLISMLAVVGPPRTSRLFGWRSAPPSWPGCCRR